MRKLVDEYQKIQVDPQFKERIEKIMLNERKKQRKNIFKWTVGTAACIVATASITLNAIPSVAYALTDVPVIGQMVNVITFGRYKSDNNGYYADIKTPKIEGLLNTELQNKLNAEFKENAKVLIMAYEEDVKELQKEFGDETIHLGIESDYTVRCNNEDVLSLDVYIFNVVGSSSTKHTFYNINKKTGQLIELKSLFAKDSDYVTPISEYIKTQMKKENETNNGLFWMEDDEFTESFNKIKENQNFFINDSGRIVICFDKYEVAAGAQGCPEFEIPEEIIEGIFKGLK